ncbi:hypothetical protein AusDCA_3394 [Desulfitobacterium sp. AusDCA]
MLRGTKKELAERDKIIFKQPWRAAEGTLRSAYN